jgi:hypothetical protein
MKTNAPELVGRKSTLSGDLDRTIGALLETLRLSLLHGRGRVGVEEGALARGRVVERDGTGETGTEEVGGGGGESGLGGGGGGVATGLWNGRCQ